MFFISTRDKTPIYEQLVRQVRDGIATGAIPPGTALPSVRSLSSELGINPNTIQRAYKMMEEAGLTYSIPGKGSFIIEDTGTLKDEQKQRQCALVLQELITLRNLGVPQEQAAALVSQAYEGGKDK